MLSRRIIPTLQLVYNSLMITRNNVNKTLTVSYRPNNCSTNIGSSSIRQVVLNVSMSILKAH
jgi:hypothetical protein